jgi:glyoxylase I family protein
MSDIAGIAHFSIPVSNLEASRAFYCDVVGCRHLATPPHNAMSFLDAGGVCIILCKHPGPINPVAQDSEGVHHSFQIAPGRYDAALQRLHDNGVEIFFEEDRQSGVVNGPRAYFRDPDGTVLEFIDLTSYSGTA